MLDFQIVRQIALALPNVEDGMSYRAPALKVGGKLMIRLREDLGAIVVRTTFDEREVLMAEQPERYFITDHYLNYQWVLVRLANIDELALREIIGRAHQLAGSGSKKK